MSNSMMSMRGMRQAVVVLGIFFVWVLCGAGKGYADSTTMEAQQGNQAQTTGMENSTVTNGVVPKSTDIYTPMPNYPLPAGGKYNILQNDASGVVYAYNPSNGVVVLVNKSSSPYTTNMQGKAYVAQPGMYYVFTK